MKINDNFSFGLEFNSQIFQEIPFESDEESEYELYAIILHCGTAHGGHYHAYIRDVLKEGNWEKMMEEIQSHREELKKKAIAEAEEQKSKKIEENLNEMEIESKKQSEEILSNEVVEEIPKNNEEKIEKSEKNGKKGKNKGGKKPKKEGKNKKTNESNKKKEKEKVEYVKDDFFDDLEFPIPFKNNDLAKNWFDFNDSMVKPISVNRIQKQFGGSNESAYILIYRQKKMDISGGDFFVIPPYLEKTIELENMIAEKERQEYAEAEKHVEIYILESQDINVILFKTK